MADLLSIGSTGISVYQRALATVSNNIANLTTEGYSRQTTEIRQSQPTEVGNGFLGTGAYFDRVSRQYDSFLESSLQQATSDLESQGATVEYANRLLDVLGDEKIGLTSAMNQFFSSAKSLSTDPVSPALRGIMLSESEALASRFQGLAVQIDDLGEQSLSALEAEVRAVNALTGQIAEVNRQTLKKTLVIDQAPELLDRRDQLLRDLSEYVQIKTTFDKRGAVTVSLSESSRQGLIVSGIKSQELAVSKTNDGSSRLDYRLQGELGNESLTGIPSGSVAGYSRFYEETLVQVNNSLNELASVFVGAVNQVQTTGLNANGDLGTNFFEVVPSFYVDQGASSGNFDVEISVSDSEVYQPRQLMVAYDEPNSRWYAEDIDGDVVVSNAAGILEFDGIVIEVKGAPTVGDQFILNPDASAARGMRLALDMGSEIATASLFRVTPSTTNSGISDPQASFVGKEQISSARLDLIDLEGSRAVEVEPSQITPLTVITAGQKNVEFTIDLSSGSNASLQILTTDGRHLVGSGADSAKRQQMVDSLEQFSPNASYDSAYLNQTGMSAYKDFELLYGLKVDAEHVTDLMPIDSLYFEAPVGTDFAGGGLDLTLEPASPLDRLGLENSLYPKTSLGTVTVVDNILYLGRGESVIEIGTIDETYEGTAQTLRVAFSEVSEEVTSDLINDDLAARIATLLTFNNGKNLESSDSVIKKRVTAEIFTADRQVRLSQGRDFISSDLISAGRVSTTNSKFVASLTGRGIEYSTGAGRILIDEGDIALNGTELGSLVISDSGILSASDVKAWVDSANTDVETFATNLLEIPKDLLRLTSGVGLQINGHSVTSHETGSLTRFDSADDLVASINAETDSTGVFASILRNGNVALQNNDLGGDNIVLSGSSAGLGTNALGISSKAYIGSISMRLESGDGDPIRFDLGQSGEPSNLNILGLDTQIRLSGQIDEDLLVFVGGSGTAMISAHSERSDLSVADGLRSRRIEFEFTASDRYVIRDLTTNTILGERTYQGEVSLDYQGIEIVLDQQARIGDSFIVDGNNLGPGGSFDAQGNNSNVLRMIDIESTSLLAGDLTLTEGYLSFVGDVGNVATQSEIARDALEIVRKQAIEARDRVAGVNLDKEAADLIRFQQAYQASAQVMQAATKIFDAILQIR